MRKIAVVGGFAVGAALTLAPLASADSLTDTVDSEIASLNSLFDSAKPPSRVTPPTSHREHRQPFDTIPLDGHLDRPGTGTTPFDYLLYGLNPIAQAARTRVPTTCSTAR